MTSMPAAPDFSQYDKINYGCGYDKRPGYLNVDIDPACDPDYLISTGDFSGLPKRHFVELIAKDVLEHIPRVKSLEALLEFSSLLRMDGRMVVETTDLLQVGKKFREHTLFAEHFGWTQCLFGTQAHPGDFHFTGFTDATLTVHLEAAGFHVERRSLVDDWMMHYECVKFWAWDDLDEPVSSNPDFLVSAYGTLLDREPDEGGRDYFLQSLATGNSRRSVLRSIASAPERLYVVAKALGI